MSPQYWRLLIGAGVTIAIILIACKVVGII